MLLKAGANVNTMDLWQFTPLHEAASKYRVEVGSLLRAVVTLLSLIFLKYLGNWSQGDATS